MTTAVQVFNFESNPIRVTQDAQGEPIWVVQDVADALGIVRGRDAVADFPEDEKGAVSVSTPGGVQQQ